MSDVATFMQTDDSKKLATDFFNGSDFCDGKSPPLPKNECQQFNKWFTPASMTVLGQVMALSPQAVCQIGFKTCM